MKAHEIVKLINEWGGYKTLSAIFECYDKPFKCPNCYGSGNYMKEFITENSDPSWWGPPMVRHEKTECPLCNGHGWTEKEYKPKLVQSGWEVQK